MTKIRIMSIIFLSSILMFSNSIEPEFTHILFRDTPLVVQKHVSSPGILIKMANSIDVKMNISKIELDTNTSMLVESNIIIQGEISYQFNQNGIYVFTFISSGLNEMSLRNKGISFVAWLWIGIAGSAFIVTYYLEQRKSEF